MVIKVMAVLLTDEKAVTVEGSQALQAGERWTDLDSGWHSLVYFPKASKSHTRVVVRFCRVNRDLRKKLIFLQHAC